MSELLQEIPARCQACPNFTGNIDSLGEARMALRMAKNNRDAYRGVDEATSRLIEGDIANIEGQIAVLEDDVRRNLALTAGCPGVDLSYSVGSGEPARIARCRSPLIDTVTSGDNC